MIVTTQRRIGIWLLCLSVVAYVVAWVAFSHSRVVGSGSSGNATWTASEVTSDVSWRYWLPILVCGVIGVFCLVRSSRKPPKLPE
jgi:uncharacterized membrane protein YfcA